MIINYSKFKKKSPVTQKLIFQFSQYPGRELHPSENNGKPHSPNVINIDLDSERSRNVVTTKNFPVGEPIDSKEYSPSPFINMRQPFMPFRGETTEMWKANRRLPSQQPPPQPITAHSNKNSNPSPTGTGRPPPDERQIIRMSQPPSPRAKSSSIPSENYHYPSPPCGVPQTSSPHRFLDCYMKNRIVEVMRTEDDKRPEDGSSDSQRRTPQQQQQQRSSHLAKDIDRSSTPGDMVIDEDGPTNQSTLIQNHVTPHGHHPHSAHLNSQFAQPPVTTFATTYAYPFNALTVAAASLPPPIKTNIDGETPARNNPPLPPAQEPKPLLSAQYEALSDED